MGMPVLPLSTGQNSSCRKIVLDRQRYKYILRQVSIPVSAIAVGKDKQFVIVIPSMNHKKLICSFRAGRASFANNVVTPEKAKGELLFYMKAETQILLQWRDYFTQEVKLEITLKSNECEYGKIAECTDGEVYLLTIRKKDTFHPKYYFFWSQEKKSSEKDKEFCFVLNHHLKNPHPQCDIDYAAMFGGEIEVQNEIGNASIMQEGMLELQRLLNIRKKLSISPPKNSSALKSLMSTLKDLDLSRENSDEDEPKVDMSKQRDQLRSSFASLLLGDLELQEKIRSRARRRSMSSSTEPSKNSPESTEKKGTSKTFWSILSNEEEKPQKINPFYSYDQQMASKLEKQEQAITGNHPLVAGVSLTDTKNEGIPEDVQETPDSEKSSSNVMDILEHFESKN